MFIDPTFPDVARTPDASIIEILFLEGRTIDQKQNLFRRIADRAVSAGFSGDDVMIVLSENAPVDWSLGRGRAFGDHHAAMTSPADSTCADGAASAVRKSGYLHAAAFRGATSSWPAM